jgi:hypothetical protein
MKRVLLGAVALCAVAGGFGYRFYRQNLTVELPVFPAPAKTVWLEQNWSRDTSAWFHHADQGTLTFNVPFEWFVALEQPTLSLSDAGMLADPAYLGRFGFIIDPADADPSHLPVGFARGGPMPRPDGSPWLKPGTGTAMTGLGLTCAACHTGRFTYHGTEVLVDGGPALTNLDKLRTGLGLSLLFTRYVPFRFERFARRVLGASADAKAVRELRAQLDGVLVLVKTIHDLDTKVAPLSVQEGFGRLDALNRIGNQVFGLDLNTPDNYVATSAPVHFPRVWDSSWFLWVQYDASIEQPIVRNAGEALGVSAWVNLLRGGPDLFKSSVQIEHVYQIEQALAGKQPDAANGFSGLRAPKWPAGILPPVDQTLADKGAVLYSNLCQHCHLAPVGSADFWSSDRWQKANAAGERYLDPPLLPIAEVGTDPAQAAGLAYRKLVLPADLGIGSSDFGPALGELVEKVVDHWYAAQSPPIPDGERLQMSGNRPNGIQAPLAYKARPLDGVWATPPYLHNASVPSLYALLSPVGERPRVFYLGNREFDPVDVGYRQEAFAGGFAFDVSKPGNLNTGHEFNDGSGPGVIGRKLQPEERRELIAYLKTL